MMKKKKRKIDKSTSSEKLYGRCPSNAETACNLSDTDGQTKNRRPNEIRQKNEIKIVTAKGEKKKIVFFYI